MLSARNYASQWTVQRLTHQLLPQQTYAPILTPLVTQSRRHFHRTRQSSPDTFIDRCQKNIGRLYARRILDIAIASAAASRAKTTFARAVEKPSDWENWERKDWSDELLASLGKSKFSRLFTSVKRLVSLSLLVSPMIVLYPVSLISSTVKDWTWSYALWGIEKAGPTYIKLTQWATTRHDLFSPAFCAYFGQLRDHTAGHAYKETLKILQQDLGDDIVNNVLKLQPVPIGSGCIAQVYKGQLLKAVGQYPQGTEIAVKVQHPGIWHKVCVDFYIMAKVAKWLEALPRLNLRYLALSDTVRQFRDIMLPQLDLTLEAAHLQRFNRDFSSNDKVDFPMPLTQLTRPRVLTETFIYGTPILEFLKAPEEVRKELAYLGLNTTLTMIFLNDFLHGDLHPGNIMIGKTKYGKYKYLLLDCGLVVEMGPQQHVNLVKILGAFTRREGRLAGQLMVDTSSDCQASPLDVELFVTGIQRIIEEDEDQNFVEKVGDYIADIMFLACKHKVKLEASFVNAALSIEIIEGIASALYPPIVVTKTALPLVMKAEMMHRLPKFSLCNTRRLTILHTPT